MRGLVDRLKGLAQRGGRHEQASGTFVGLPLNPAVFDFRYGRDVIEPLSGNRVLKASVKVAMKDEMADFVGDGKR